MYRILSLHSTVPGYPLLYHNFTILDGVGGAKGATQSVHSLVTFFWKVSLRSKEIVYIANNFQNNLAVKLNSGKPVSHCLTWVAFSLIWVMLGDSSVNSLSKQLVSLSPFSFGTYGGVTFP